MTDRVIELWHQLATIHVHEGAYPAAQDKFQRSLAINQQSAATASSSQRHQG
jgi:hypothetical protein